MYEYRAFVLRVVDGDTIDVETDLGFSVVLAQRLRLAGINAPEVKGAEREKGLETAAWLRNRIEGREVVIRTIQDKQEKYGRYLAEVFLVGVDVSLNQEMVQLGLAKLYGG